MAERILLIDLPEDGREESVGALGPLLDLHGAVRIADGVYLVSDAGGTNAWLERFAETVVSRGGRVAIGDVRWVYGAVTRT